MRLGRLFRLMPLTEVKQQVPPGTIDKQALRRNLKRYRATKLSLGKYIVHDSPSINEAILSLHRKLSVPLRMPKKHHV